MNRFVLGSIAALLLSSESALALSARHTFRRGTTGPKNVIVQMFQWNWYVSSRALRHLEH
jgi:hypothetical protein